MTSWSLGARVTALSAMTALVLGLIAATAAGVAVHNRNEVDRLIPVLREVMEGALPLDVPLTVDIKVGDDWDSMTPVSRCTRTSATRAMKVSKCRRYAIPRPSTTRAEV